MSPDLDIDDADFDTPPELRLALVQEQLSALASTLPEVVRLLVAVRADHAALIARLDRLERRWVGQDTT